METGGGGGGDFLSQHWYHAVSGRSQRKLGSPQRLSVFAGTVVLSLLDGEMVSPVRGGERLV